MDSHWSQVRRLGQLLDRTPWEQTLNFVQFIRWQAITAFDVVVELLLFGISLYMLHGLTFKTKKKLIVLSAFALRLPSVIWNIKHRTAELLKLFLG